MLEAPRTRSADVRSKISHPIIDGDGHTLEFFPLALEYMREIGGPKVVERYLATLPGSSNHHDYIGAGEAGLARVGGPKGWFGLTTQQRREMRVTRPTFWVFPTSKAIDRASSMLPRLFRDRLDEFGIDFAIVYGSLGLNFARNPDDEIRRVGCRALNTMYHEMYGPYAERMTVAALIPCHTPEEALDELDYAIKGLGMKVAVLGSNIRRPIAELERRAPEVASYAKWVDNLALDSEYDYDPVWQKCVDLKVAVTAHSGSLAVGTRTSPSCSVYNRIGHFGQAGEAFCKAIVMGGVARRFPTLTFAFLEGGVGWACSLYNDFIEIWEKRNVKSLKENLDLARVDMGAMGALLKQYGDGLADRPIESLLKENRGTENPAELDEWAAAAIDGPRTFAELFDRFFFGCEADDRMTSVAFNEKLNHFGVKLHALFSSDIGHWDVPDPSVVVAEAYENVEHGLMTEADFRAFAYGNAIKLHCTANPDFFKGTAVEDAVNRELR